MLIFEYENNRRIESDKNGLGTVLHAEKDSRGIKEQPVGWTIKRGIRDRNGRRIV